jgi:DNA-binding response OmpR family regulator
LLCGLVLDNTNFTEFDDVTGYGLESDKMKAQEAGIDHYIVKPVDLTRLRELLSVLAEQST